MKKNICFFISDISNVGGTERVTSIIANEMSKLDKYNITILSIMKTKDTVPFNIDENIKIYNIFNEEVSFRKKYLKLMVYLRKFIAKNNIDIIIDVDTILDLISIPAIKLSKSKLISWEHFCYYGNSHIKSRKIARMLSCMYSDYIITLTEDDKQTLKEKLNVKAPIEYIYNPIIEKDKNIEYNCESKVILSVGRLSEQKGFDMLIDIAKDVLLEYNEWKWVILGDGEDRHLLQEKIKKYNLQDKVLLKGNVLNVDEYYKTSSMLVSTSRYEGLPMVLLEGKSYKLPLVSFNCKTGPSEIIKDRHNGYLVECFDIPTMSKKIKELIESKELRKYFSDNYSYDINKFELNYIIKKWEKIIDNM